MRTTRRASRSILVVGNGPTAVEASGVYHVERVVGNLLLGLADRGLEVALVQPIEPFQPQANYFGLTLPADQPGMIALDTRGLFGKIRGAWAMFQAIRRAGFAYIFYPGTLPRLAAFFCRVLRRPFALYLRGERFSSGLDLGLFRRAQFVLAVSDGLLSAARSAGTSTGLIQPDCHVDLSAARHPDRSRGAGDPIRLLFVGRLEADKGVPELIAAAEMLRGRGVRFALKLIGGGPLHSALASRFPPSSASDIQVAGVIGEKALLAREYEEADIFVLPTHHEGFPRVLYEAMAKSAVIVTTMVGGIPALMRDGENCLAIPVGDPAAIAAAVEQLSEDPQLGLRLAENALDTVTRVFTERPRHLDALLLRLSDDS